MTTESTPREVGSSEVLGPDAEWVRAWFEERYKTGDLFVDGPECLTLEAAADLVRDVRALQNELVKAELRRLQQEAGDRHNYYGHALVRMFGA